MTVEVLKSLKQNSEARAKMRRRGIDCLSSKTQRMLRKFRMAGGVNVGEPGKSWDVLKTVQFIEENLPAEAPILDIGAFASEVLCVLHRLKYTDLTGVDLNPGIKEMPYNDSIRYVVSDFMKTPFDDASFAAVTAISVIEHGFKSQELLTELARILKVGGYFIASVDYWPEKVETHNIKAFGMDWRIFSEEELCAFIKEAGDYGFHPVGEMDFKAGDRTVEWNERRYTFAWLVLQKVW